MKKILIKILISLEPYKNGTGRKVNKTWPSILPRMKEVHQGVEKWGIDVEDIESKEVFRKKISEVKYLLDGKQGEPNSYFLKNEEVEWIRDRRYSNERKKNCSKSYVIIQNKWLDWT